MQRVIRLEKSRQEALSICPLSMANNLLIPLSYSFLECAGMDGMITTVCVV